MRPRKRTGFRRHYSLLRLPQREEETAMGKYFLHLTGFDGDLIEDEEGTDFPTFAAARKT